MGIEYVFYVMCLVAGFALARVFDAVKRARKPEVVVASSVATAPKKRKYTKKPKQVVTAKAGEGLNVGAGDPPTTHPEPQMEARPNGAATHFN